MTLLHTQNPNPREQRARSYLDNTIETDVIDPPVAPSSSLVRSILGVPSHCVSEEHGLQFPCSFTPSCWISGGVPQTGCDSLIYACCVSPAAAAAISRKVGPTEMKFCIKFLKNNI